MAYLLINDRFYQAPEVLELENREIGLWVRMASYHARWPGYDIPASVVKMCDGRAPDVRRLIETGWLIRTGKGFQLGMSDTGLWKIGQHSEARAYRPAIPLEVRSAVFERDGRACLQCFATEDLTLDHIIPWSHGGPDTVENLRVFCRSCNSRRGNRVEAEA